MTSLINLTQLRSFSYTLGNEIVYVQGHTTIGDGGQGNFYWDDSSSEVDNDGTIIEVTGVSGRWKRVYVDIVNVQWFGAKGKGSILDDDTIPIQNALNFATLGSILIPSGTYYTTSTLYVPSSTGIIGQGYTSILKPQGCDCLTLLHSNALAPTIISNFHISGTGCEENVGINIPGTIETANKLTGVTIESIFITNFLTGILARTFWHSTIRKVSILNSWNGIQIIGQSVKIVIEDCSIVLGEPYEQEGNSTGIYIGLADNYNPGGHTEHRPEDVQIHKTIVYGFNIGCNYEHCLYGIIEGNDFDFCSLYGVTYSQSDGGLVIKDNWIAIFSETALYGVFASSIAVESINMPIISGNYIIGYDMVLLSEGSIGICIDANQFNVIIENNQISGMKNVDIFTQYTKNLKIINNNCRSTDVSAAIYIISTIQNTYIDGNIIAKPLFVHPTSNGNVIIGHTYGLQSTLIQGRITIPSGFNSASVLFSALNGSPPDFITDASSYLGITVNVDTADISLGNLSGVGTSTGVTINCDNAPSSDTIVRFTARAVANLD